MTGNEVFALWLVLLAISTTCGLIVVALFEIRDELRKLNERGKQ